MNQPLAVLFVFALLFAPFVLLLILLRFAPQERREKMFKFNIPIWRSLPKGTKQYLLAAAYMVAVCVGGEWTEFRGTIIGILLWASVAFCLGMAVGHWEARRGPPWLRESCNADTDKPE